MSNYEERAVLTQRACVHCGAPITACFGSVVARDLADFLEGKLAGDRVRELCATCILRVSLTSASFPDTRPDWREAWEFAIDPVNFGKAIPEKL